MSKLVLTALTAFALSLSVNAIAQMEKNEGDDVVESMSEQARESDIGYQSRGRRTEELLDAEEEPGAEGEGEVNAAVRDDEFGYQSRNIESKALDEDFLPGKNNDLGTSQVESEYEDSEDELGYQSRNPEGLQPEAIEPENESTLN